SALRGRGPRARRDPHLGGARRGSRRPGRNCAVRYAAAIRQPTGGVGAGLVGSVVVHAGVVAFLWVAVQPPPPSPPSYAVELVAAPAPKPEQKPAPESVTRPPAEP